MRNSRHSHQSSGSCTGRRAQLAGPVAVPTLRVNRPSTSFGSTLLTAASMFAGNTAIVSTTNPSAEIFRVAALNMPIPSSSSAAPLARLANAAPGNQSGTIASKKSGLAKWATPAPAKTMPAAIADGGAGFILMSAVCRERAGRTARRGAAHDPNPLQAGELIRSSVGGLRWAS